MNTVYKLIQEARSKLYAPEVLKARGLTDEQIAKIKEVANARAEQRAVQHCTKQE